jgi:predicted helicase
LYIYTEDNNPVKNNQAFLNDHFAKQSKRTPNFSREFLKQLDEIWGNREKLSSEDIIYYIYAVLYSPGYRDRYSEFLKIDYPRVPLTPDRDLFRDLVGKGSELVNLHLLESPRLEQPITRFTGWAENTVASGYPKYSDGTVWINPQQGFEGLPPEVWEFYIGGYQVCHKWLKDRRGRQLSEEEIIHYQKIVVALKETIRLMAEIDELIEAHGGWPIQ